MIDFNLDTIPAVAGVLLGSGALLGCLIMSISVRRWRARCLAVESSLAAMRREVEVLASISLRTGSRVKRIEQEYSGVAERVELVELRGAAASFDEAIDSARRGTDPGRLTQQFGLSRVEADLVTRLHGRKKIA
ncbi:MAG TPA: DUF2802 domain-containing protein [Steroidobacteraceae bacterium]|jgi:hypothetical protein|nr:DUF2802 domain-containing protein [Steroidobacteraceae bacterium]